MRVINKELVDIYARHKSRTTLWVIHSLLPKPPFILSDTHKLSIELFKYSPSMQKRIKNTVSGFVSIAAKYFYIQDVLKKVDFKEHVNSNELRFAIFLSLIVNDGLKTPIVMKLSDINKIRSNNNISYSRKYRYVFRNKVLSAQTQQLLMSLAATVPKNSLVVNKKNSVNITVYQRKRLSSLKKEILGYITYDNHISNVSYRKQYTNKDKKT